MALHRISGGWILCHMVVKHMEVMVYQVMERLMGQRAKSTRKEPLLAIDFAIYSEYSPVSRTLGSPQNRQND